MLDFSEMSAANEDDYRYQPHRTAPISSTITPIHNYPKKLRIYLTNASPYWQVCCYFKGKTYKRSLKTTIRQVAIRAAKDYFHQMVANLYGSTITPREDRALLFSDLVAPTIAIETARTQRGEYSIAGLNILRNRLHKSVEPLKWTPKTGQQFKWDTVTRNGVNHDRDQKAQRSPAGVQSQGGA